MRTGSLSSTVTDENRDRVPPARTAYRRKILALCRSSRAYCSTYPHYNLGMLLRPVPIRLLPLAVGAILIATAIPVALRAPVVGIGEFGWDDFVANMMLFAPFGVALRYRSAWFILVVAALFSTGVEISQIWSIGRFVSVYDVAANTSGALVAALAARAAERRGSLAPCELHAGPWTMIALCAVVIAVIVVWRIPHPSSAVAGWDRSYPLQLGNERTGDRPWHGTIAALGIWPKAIAPRDLKTVSTGEFSAIGAVYVTRQPLVFTGGPALRLPDDMTQAFVAAAIRASAFTIAARIKTADVEQRGPARILSFSIDPYHRNVDLGQQERKLVFRVRTKVSGLNGDDSHAESNSILRAGSETVILANYDGSIERIYVDGTLVARVNLAAVGCFWPALCDVDAPGVWASLAAIATLLGVFLFGRRDRRTIWLVATLAVGVVLALGIVHPDPVHRPWERWSSLYALIGAVNIALSVRVSSRTESSGQKRPP